VTVPRATRCNRRVAPGRLSPAAPSGRGNATPREAREAGRGGRARPFGGFHRFAGGPVIPAPASPSRLRPPPPASPTPAGRRAPGAPDVPTAEPQERRGPHSSTVRALRFGKRLQRRPGRPLTLSREAGRWSRRRERSPAAQSGRRGPEVQGASTGSLWAPSGRQTPCRRRIGPNKGAVLCPRATGVKRGGATRRASGISTWYIYRGGGHGEGPSGSPCHSAAGLSSPGGQVAVA